MTRAPLRWAGSKRKSLAALQSNVPSDYTRYIEPFAGSACFVFSLSPRKIVLGDLNSNLVEFYQQLVSDPLALHDVYSSLSVDEETYYSVRSDYNSALPGLRRAGQFLYLNRLCFNGIYRVNSKGHFNVPWGGSRLAKPLTREELTSAAEHLSDALVICSDFDATVRTNLTTESFVYLDPPYARDEARVFREYHEKSFATADWERLEDLLYHIDKTGAQFLLSYAGDDSLLERLSHWSTGYIDVTRNVGGFRASRRKHREFIAKNYEN